MITRKEIEKEIQKLKTSRGTNFLYASIGTVIGAVCAPYSISQIANGELEMALLGGGATLASILLTTKSISQIKEYNKAIKKENRVLEYFIGRGINVIEDIPVIFEEENKK